MNNRAHSHLQLIVSLALLAAGPATTAVAHHSPAMYDSKQVVTVTGVVKKYDWANPHVYIYVEQATEAGKIEWEVEGFPPAMLRRMGWDRDHVRIGDTLTITGPRARNPHAKSIFPTTIKRGDSTLFAFQNTFQAGAPKAEAKAAASSRKANSLNGVWSSAVTVQVIGQGVSPSASKLTAQGAEALKRFDEKTSPTSNCIPIPAPWWMFTPELKRITLGDDVIVIDSETEGQRRTIHMNVTSHDGALPSIQGHSIGRWEGKSLVIDTTHFAYHGTGNGGGNGIGRGVPSGTRKHLIERLTLGADGMSLTYRYDLTDPEFLAVPRTSEVQLTYAPDARFEVEKCDMESAHRFFKG